MKDEDDFVKWQKEVSEAEAAAAALKNGNAANDAEPDVDDGPSTPPDGEEEFTDDDGCIYKWVRGLRKWVPQVSNRAGNYARMILIVTMRWFF